MRFLVALLVLLSPQAASAQEPRGENPQGRYQGLAFDLRPDGTRGAQVALFMIFRPEGREVACSGGTGSFDEQVPCEEVVLAGSRIRFAMPFGGGVVFELVATGKSLKGTLRAKPGVPAPPFNAIELERVADLTLADRFRPLEGESAERSPAILQLRQQIADGHNAAPAEFWKRIAQSGAPLVEPLEGSQRSALVTFVWKGSAETKNVFLVWPRLSSARPDDYFFSNLPGTDIWFKTLKVRNDARMYYQISPDDPRGERPPAKRPRRAQADPLNPKREGEGSAAEVRSLLELPQARPQPWYAKRPDVRRYASSEEQMQSTRLKSPRKVLVYLPPGYAREQAPYPSIYLMDGEDPDGLVFATATFENLVAEGRIPATVVIRILNPDQETRNRELACDPAFTAYVNDELVPFVRNKFHTAGDPSKTAIGGYSLGGLAAAFAALTHPETFGMVLSQSGSYWFEPTHEEYAEPNWIARQFAEHAKLPVRFYLDAGTNELDARGDGSGILATNRHLRDVLRAKNYELSYQEFSGDHEYINWRGTQADGLIWLFGGSSQ